MDDDGLRTVVFADSSLNNRDDEDFGENVRSQLGFVCLLCDDGLYKHGEGPVHVLDWSSTRVRRVCRASMAAEAHGLTEGAEALEWIRALFFELAAPAQQLGPLLDEVAAVLPAKWFDDAHSLVSHLLADASQVPKPEVEMLKMVLKPA